MADALRVPYIDYSNETSTVSLDVLSGATNPAVETFRVALTALTYTGDQEAIRLVQAVIGGTNAGKSAEPESQREKKWLVKYHRASDAAYSYSREIPCADLNNLSSNGETIDLTAGVGLTFKTNFELIIVDPRDDSAVILDEIEFVGRNI